MFVYQKQNTEHNLTYVCVPTAQYRTQHDICDNKSFENVAEKENVGVSLCLPENRETTNLLAVLTLINDNMNKMLQSGTLINLSLES
jgi:hypothetical protein